MTTCPKIPVHGTLADDILKVREASRDDIAERLLSLHATDAEALDWYYANDPLAEDSNNLMASVVSGDFGVNGEKLQAHLDGISIRPSYFEYAGLTLLASIINPDSTKYSSVRWAGYPPFIYYTTDNVLLGDERMVKPLIENLPTTMDEEQLRKAYVAADCLHYAGKTFAVIPMILDVNNEDVVSAQDKELVRSKSIAYSDAALALANLVRNYGYSERATTPEQFKIGYLAGQSFYSWLVETAAMVSPNDSIVMRQLSEIARLDAFFGYVDNIDKYFCNNPYQPERKVIKGEDKGLLHEAIWMLDLNFLFTNQSEITGVAIPTSPRLDSPLINRPSLRRAYDVHVGITGKTIPVQLKSTPLAAERGSYHPNIHVVAENNFEDVDLRRLRAKLAKYRNWIESGYSSKALDELLPYILPSAREFFETIKEIDQQSATEYILSKIPTNGLDRAAKRRLKRAIRKEEESRSKSQR